MSSNDFTTHPIKRLLLRAHARHLFVADTDRLQYCTGSKPQQEKMSSASRLTGGQDNVSVKAGATAAGTECHKNVVSQRTMLHLARLG